MGKREMKSAGSESELPRYAYEIAEEIRSRQIEHVRDDVQGRQVSQSRIDTMRYSKPRFAGGATALKVIQDRSTPGCSTESFKNWLHHSSQRLKTM